MTDAGHDRLRDELRVELEAAEGWTRHPADVARLVASLIGLVVVLGATELRPGAVRGISRDLVTLIEWLPDVLAVIATGIAQILAIVGPFVILAVLAFQRRARLLVLVVAGAVAAAGVAAILQGWLDDQVPPETTGFGGSWITGDAFPSASYIAALTAAMTILGPNLPHRWRRLGHWVIGIAVVLRLATAVAVPLHIGATLFIGLAVGSLALVLAGAPSRQVRVGDLRDALARLGVRRDTLASTEVIDRFRGELDDGTSVTIDLVDRDDRDAEIFLRAVNAARVRGIDDEHPGWSTERVAEREALVTLLAAGACRVPEVLGVASSDSGAALIVSRARDTSSLDQLEYDAISDDLLAEVWTQVAGLHSRRIAHRALDRRHVAVDQATGEVVLVHLRRGRPGADDTLLAIDVAELLCTLALVVGTERATRSAVQVLGTAAVAAALPVLQPLALSPHTRKQIKALDDGQAFLESVREEVQSRTGTEAIELLPLHRLTVGGVVSLFGTVFLCYVALAFVSNWSRFIDSLGEADWTYLPWVLIFSAAGFVAGALSLMGAVTGRLPLGLTTEVMLGQSFLNRFTPANAGGMALRVRYLQINGIELAVGAASIGLTSAASGAMQAVFLIVFLTWSSQAGGLPFSFPDIATLALIVLVLLALCGLLWLTPLRRKVLDSRAFSSVHEIWAEIRQLATSPTKVVLLFGGAGMGKLCTIFAFVLSVWAFDIDLTFPVLAALYMTANTVASAAPTPGGVGAIEAALIAALTGAGVDSAIAFSAVMVFRIINYWLPVPFAWLALQDLRRKEIV